MLCNKMLEKIERVYVTLSCVDATPLVVLQSKAIRNQPFGLHNEFQLVHSYPNK